MAKDLEHGRACYDRGAWHEAFEALRLADQAAPLDRDDLQRLGTAAYLLGQELEFERYFDRLYHVELEHGYSENAARAAFWLGLSLLFRGEIAHSNAWIARGQRLIAQHDCVEQGYLSLPGTERILREGHAATAQARAAAAALIGERFGDADLVAMARHVEARALIEQHQIAAGLDLLDEVMLPVVAGELSPITTGLMYCSVLAACTSVCALSRAREWTFAFSRWCDRHSEPVAFSSTCLVHRAEVLRSQGAWSDALEDACRACDRAGRGGQKPPPDALYQQGEIHRLRGEHTEAEEAYRAASQLGYDPQPGLALLRLAEGQIETACAALRRVLHSTTREPERARGAILQTHRFDQRVIQLDAVERQQREREQRDLRTPDVVRHDADARRTQLLQFGQRLDAGFDDRDATSFSYEHGAGMRAGSELFARTPYGLEWEHTVNRLVSQRFRVLATLELEVFR
jgi:tetratricopeptide (TPR) repeat protein